MNNNNSTYKRLGDYIREVDVRNSEREVNLSQGICNQKYFQNPRQVSATPHLDKIVRKGQFAYNRATTRNGNKISIAYREGEDCTVSSAYCVFYIIDEEKLNPYYLWLWFKHPDFDRYAIFKSHGSAHEFFEFETLCDTYVPIPPIEEQRKIVDHYLAIQNRIANNKQTIAKLEEAAQALYRKMFVDDVDVENLPDGWRMGTLGEVCEISAGGDKPECFSETKDAVCYIPIFANGVENDGLYGYTNKPKITSPSVTISARGTIGFVCLRMEPYVPIVRLLVCIPNKLISNAVLYLFYLLKNTKLEGDGAVQLQLTAPKFKEIGIVIPSKNLIEEYEKNVSSIVGLVNQIKKENEKLIELLSMVMAG